MRRRLLVVASDLAVRKDLANWLAPAGYPVELAEGPKRVREVLAAGQIAVSILDLERESSAFVDVARELCKIGGGLIALMDEVDDISRLRRLGVEADVFLTRPLDRRGVLDAVEAAMSSAGQCEHVPRRVETIQLNGMTLDIPGHLLVDGRGREIKLTPGEFAVLAALARKPGRVMSRDQLLDAVSGRSADTYDRSVDNLIARLRRKIECGAGVPHLIATVRGVGYKLLPRRNVSQTRVPPCQAMPRCAILVVPFINLAGGPGLSHFAAALSAGLAAQLRHVVGANVLYRHDNGSDGIEISSQVGARYLIRGNVRRSADDIRVNAQMLDADAGAAVWADCFDGKLADMFAFESGVTARIARAIDLEIVDIESRRDRSRGAASASFDLTMRGYACLYRPRSPSNLAGARRLFERALRLDERHAIALAGLAQTHVSDALCRWSTDPERQVRLADASVVRAIEMNPKLAYAYHVRGLVLRVRRQHERAIAAFDMAAELNPSLAPAWAEIGFTKAALDRGASALARVHESLAMARRISPRDPVLANWLYGVGMGHLKCGDTAVAIRLLNESIGLNPLPPALAYLAAAYALNGDDEQARSALREFVRKQPFETLRSFGRRLFADHQVLPGSVVFEGLRKAGLREQ